MLIWRILYQPWVEQRRTKNNTLKKIQSALVSVYSKDGLGPIIESLHQHGVTIYSTGGTQAFIEKMNVPVERVEDLTSYPSILDGRVKTLHPKVFGGILARREKSHLDQLEAYAIPEIDLVIVDLYPFEDTVASTDDESTIIEKIDIGGISLIRAAAKNFNDVVCVASKDQYGSLLEVLQSKNGSTEKADRKQFALESFKVSSNYDVAITNYFKVGSDDVSFKSSIHSANTLRYGENPHQAGTYFGKFKDDFDILGGKALSYNNLVDIDAAISLMREFKDDDPTFCVFKHTNACGVATRESIFDAWEAALACDNVSAFGGILIANRSIDLKTAEAINTLFYEVLIAPDFDQDAFDLLSSKKKRVLLKLKQYPARTKMFKSLLSGVIEQDLDLQTTAVTDLTYVTDRKPDDSTTAELLFAEKCAKHLKSNTIAITKNRQLIGMGCGQTSRVDALRQAIHKAGSFGFDVEGAVMASDAFFPFPDCVEIGCNAGIRDVIQPGGSIKDQLSIDFCNANDMSMVMTGTRHFKH